MSDRKKMLKSFSDTFGAKYDSDKDLTKAEQKKIEYSRNPSKAREKIWDKKGLWKKTKKLVKSGWYGDKQKKK